MINVLLPKPDMVDIDKVAIQISDETLGIITSDEIALNKIGNKQNIAYCGLESSEIQKPFSIKIDSIYIWATYFMIFKMQLS